MLVKKENYIEITLKNKPMYYKDLSLDVAITALGRMKARAIMAAVACTDEEKKEELKRDVAMYSEEERVIYFYADKHPALWESVMDKVNRLYNPIIKAQYEKSLSDDLANGITAEELLVGIEEDIREKFRKK